MTSSERPHESRNERTLPDVSSPDIRPVDETQAHGRDDTSAARTFERDFQGDAESNEDDGLTGEAFDRAYASLAALLKEADRDFDVDVARVRLKRRLPAELTSIRVPEDMVRLAERVRGERRRENVRTYAGLGVLAATLVGVTAFAWLTSDMSGPSLGDAGAERRSTDVAPAEIVPAESVPDVAMLAAAAEAWDDEDWNRRFASAQATASAEFAGASPSRSADENFTGQESSLDRLFAETAGLRRSWDAEGQF